MRDSIERSEAALFEAEEKMCLVRRSQILENSLDEIKRNVGIIRVENEKYNNSAITDSTEKILYEIENIMNYE